MSSDRDHSQGAQENVNLGNRPTLSVVMPVHNEAMYLKSTLESWITILRSLQVPFEFLAYDDESTDGSGEILDQGSENFSELHVVHQPHLGHGPTIRDGYEAAAGEWILQTDSDKETPPGEFDQLWPLRDSYDFVIGRRVGRKLKFGRKIVSACARLGVRFFYGSGVRDVNSPFRLMRGEFVRSSLPSIPKDSFAPNLHLTGLAIRGKWRVREVPVISQNHRIASVSRPLPVTFGKLLSLFGELRTVSRRART